MRSLSSDGRSKNRKGCVGPGEEAREGYLDDIGVDTGEDTALVAAEDNTLLLYRRPRAILVLLSACLLLEQFCCGVLSLMQ